MAIRVQCVFKSADAVNANNVTNTWNFVGNPTVAVGTSVTSALANFYTSIQSWYSNLLGFGGHEFKCYNPDDPAPRAPFLTTSFSFTSALNSAAAPPEVALCCSFQGNKLSGQSQARRRGRVYLGPLNLNALSATGRPAATTITSIANAGTALRVASQNAIDWDWCVRSNASGVPNDVIVTNGWVDNEFDIQRRRGRLSTARTVFG